MAGVAQRNTPHLSIELFRAFYASRPDEEHWQLIDGVAVMMTPPTPAHQRIASNLESLLNDALEIHAPDLVAYQGLGVDLAPTVEHYDPEPDVLVVDADVSRSVEVRYMKRFYLAAEIVSASDRVWADQKCEIYKLHESCNCVLRVEQDRFYVRVDLRTDTGWRDQILTKPDDVLTLPEFGLTCRLSDLYRGTPLLPPQKSKR
jgi:Uma2 family endonuclease